MKYLALSCISVILLGSLNGCKTPEYDSNTGLAELARKIRTDFYLGAFSSGLTSKDQDTLKASWSTPI